MMNAELRRYILLLANVAVVVYSVSGTDIPTIYVCPEETVQAFQNINFDCCKSNVYLTKHSGKDRINTKIANWSFKNCVLNETFQTEYDHRFSLHKNGTITIHNVQRHDIGEYDVMYENDNLPPLILEVKIYVMDAPTKDCKPIVKNTGNVLEAAVKHRGCGNPSVNVYWKCLNNDTGTERTLLNMKAGTKPCAYQYCIEGPALRCISDVSHRNYCFPSTSTMQDTSRLPSSESYSDGYLAKVVISVFLAVSVLINVIMCFSFRSEIYEMLKSCGKCCRECATKRTSGGQSTEGGQERIRLGEFGNNNLPL